MRTRDPEKLASCDIVVDVGGEYDPQRHRYDHHQRWVPSLRVFSFLDFSRALPWSCQPRDCLILESKRWSPIGLRPSILPALRLLWTHPPGLGPPWVLASAQASLVSPQALPDSPPSLAQSGFSPPAPSSPHLVPQLGLIHSCALVARPQTAGPT